MQFRLQSFVVALLAVATCFTLTHSFSTPAQLQSQSRRLWSKIQLSAVKAASKRTKTVSSLTDWAESVDIKLGGISISQSPGDDSAGLGIVSKQELPGSSLVLTVPSAVALSIESPGDGPDDRSVLETIDRKTLEKLPWYAQFSVYLHKLDKINSHKSNKVELRPWLDSLPRNFDTPIHWTESQQQELQYDFLQKSIPRQESLWKQYHQQVGGASLMKWEDFLWGCECARSRAFSGAYTGSAFNPFSYAFTLLLVLGYVGLDLGPIEQAANGAGLVFCAQIFKDFVFPKLLKKKRYVICPVMDMANHNSMGTTAEVSFEFFGDAYSLAVDNAASVPPQTEVFISYGARSNDQLLQYYGFVEPNNPHDVYVLPPLREWDVAALEKACGRTFAPGRLQKLDRAGLLGTSAITSTSADAVENEEAANRGGGVVVTRVDGVDPAVMQALRALVSSGAEWEAAGEAIGNFVEENSAGPENERLARLAAKTALELELAAKPTTIEEDEALLKRMDQVKSMDSSVADKLAVMFRIEKKKLLSETIQKLS